MIKKSEKEIKSQEQILIQSLRDDLDQAKSDLNNSVLSLDKFIRALGSTHNLSE